MACGPGQEDIGRQQASTSKAQGCPFSRRPNPWILRVTELEWSYCSGESRDTGSLTTKGDKPITSASVLIVTGTVNVTRMVSGNSVLTTKSD